MFKSTAIKALTKSDVTAFWKFLHIFYSNQYQFYLNTIIWKNQSNILIVKMYSNLNNFFRANLKLVLEQFDYSSKIKTKMR